MWLEWSVPSSTTKRDIKVVKTTVMTHIVVDTTLQHWT